MKRYAFFKTILLLIIYLVLMATVSLQTMYYNLLYEQRSIIYQIIVTVVFAYMVYHFSTGKPYRIITLVLVSLFLGFIPLELNIINAIDLVLSPTKENLSGLAERMPLVLGVLFELLFFPILVFIVMLPLNWILKAKKLRQ